MIRINGLRTRLVALFTLGVSVSACLSGCQRTSVSGSSLDTIDLKVSAVFGLFDGGYGNSNNDGCRLTELEITQIVNQARNNAPSVFGTKTRLLWDGDITQVTHTDLGALFGGIDRQDFTAADMIDYFQTTAGMFNAPAENPNYLSIYFAGSIADAWAATYDPQLAVGLPAIAQPGFITVSDGGPPIASGEDPDELKSRLTLEHEMCHFFALLENTDWPMSGTPARHYGFGEHIDPNDEDNLMGTVPTGTPRKLNLPGKESDPNTEKGHVVERIKNGTWNDP